MTQGEGYTDDDTFREHWWGASAPAADAAKMNDQSSKFLSSGPGVQNSSPQNYSNARRNLFA